MAKKVVKTKIKQDAKISPYLGIRRSLKEKEEYIEQVFLIILGRKPSPRELSYYKYNEISKEEITEKLLNSEEHIKIFKEAKENVKLRKKVEILENEKERLEDLINSKAIEYRELMKLLQNKNQEIIKLREERQDVYKQKEKIGKDKADDILSNYSFGEIHSYDQPLPVRISAKQKSDIFDKIRQILKIE